MEWYEKEDAFHKVYASGRHAKDLWQYIPEKYAEAISGCHVDSDGYWIYLEQGWAAYDHAEDCGIIHEYNIADLKAAVKTIARANRYDK